MEGKKVSIVDVARKAGVSTATVSRVVNQLGGYSKETEKKVLQTIKECGFRPNVSAIGLRTRRSRSVGVIVPDITNEFFAKIVRSLDVFFVKYNYSVLICDSHEDPELEERHIQDMFDKNVDGFIYVSGMEAISPLVKNPRVPVVFIDRAPKDAEFVVQSDNYQGGYLAGKELCQKGCSRILMIRDYRMASTIQQRRDGFLNVLTEYGRSCGGDFELTILPDYKQAKEKVREFLSEKGCCFDGIFTTNDMMALGAMHALAEAGCSVPGQVKIVGFDNVSLSEFCNPPMTTIAQDTEQMARAAGEALLRLIRKEPIEQKEYVVPVRLEVRSTT
ncbi:substrate-binding domain-containing protein [Frisingicoccus sp.]|uniref:LacI family DNA-binding transcriptional regulator n=1 Tax=Frisingicoccus sp. TaxID=1918627 RepID=UPI0015AA1279